jgi:hypothetical protein
MAKLTSCSDGLCGALDCPRCRPAASTCIGCEACDAETQLGIADARGWLTCRGCGGLFCENCVADLFERGQNFCETCYDEER